MAARDAVAVLGRARLSLALLLTVGGALAACLGRFTNTHIAGVFIAFLEGRYPFLSMFLGATFLVHVITLDGARRKPLLYAAVFAEAPTILQDVTGKPPLYPLGFGLAAVALAYRAASWFRSRGEARAAHACAIFDSLVPAYFGLVSPVFLSCTVAFLPAVADLRVERAFGGLGAGPSVSVARLFEALPALKGLCTMVYGALPIGVAVVHAIRSSRDRREPPRVLVSFALIALFGYPLYFAFPMVGPREAWAVLEPHAVFPPAVVPAGSQAWLAVKGLAPRNCMPSLHTAWALSVFLACRGRRSIVLASFGFVWLVCTLLATLGLGEHWLVDLVVAFPFAFAVDALSLPGKLRGRDAPRLVVLVALVVAWYAVLLAGLEWVAAAPVLAACAMATTVVVSWWVGLSLGTNVVPSWPAQGPSAAAFVGRGRPVST
ncbi:MAG TPA: phosphatase PAP2 family protein [Polyangiaceae bacterium]|nr:phosphatase PAP2 family protein [Polyangiaceae bacterium]